MSISSWHIDRSWTLFLDRDGVINERVFGGYISSIEAFKFLPGVLVALEKLSGLFGPIIVVTNQQGIGKDIMTERNLIAIHDYMIREVIVAGGRIDKCYFAKNLEGAEDDMRKPKAVMGNQAKMDFPDIDFKKSVMVGDSDSDILFGRNLGMKTVRIKTEEAISVDADQTFFNLQEFSNKLNNEI